MNARLRRLYADWQTIRDEFAGHKYIEVTPLHGNPPEAYEIVYHVNGLVLDPRTNRPQIANYHKAHIYLHSEYPREKPKCTMETPIFHPNFGPYICIGDYWAAGETLADIIIHIGQMIQYQNYNPKSPLNAVAARWAEQNHSYLPVGNVDLYQAEVDIDLVDDSSAPSQPQQRADDDVDIALM